MKTIKLGVSHSKEGDYSWDVFRVGGVREIKGYMDRIAWSQTHHGLGHEFYMTFGTGEQSQKEYSDADLVEVIPLNEIGTRPAMPLELGSLVSSIAENTGTNVLLHAKPKRLEEIK